MYDELYAAWRFELENSALGGLPSDFYTRAADYLRRIEEEHKINDEKTVKARLLGHELERAKCMLQELVWVRYKKIVALVTESQKIPSDLLAADEESMCAVFLNFAETYHKFAEKLLRGQILSQIPKVSTKKVQKRVTLRFIKAIPAVIGADMKPYGPFMVEDVASLPVENAKILVEKGLAKTLEVT